MGGVLGGDDEGGEVYIGVLWHGEEGGYAYCFWGISSVLVCQPIQAVIIAWRLL